MIVVGPEEPLVNGIYDHFQSHEELKSIYFVGPSRQGALLEGSKAFAKEFMFRHNIPTAAYREFTAENYEEGVAYLQEHSLPIVLKADGLAAGKGVVIAQTEAEAIFALDNFLEKHYSDYQSRKKEWEKKRQLNKIKKYYFKKTTLSRNKITLFFQKCDEKSLIKKLYKDFVLK